MTSLTSWEEPRTQKKIKKKRYKNINCRRLKTALDNFGIILIFNQPTHIRGTIISPVFRDSVGINPALLEIINKEKSPQILYRHLLLRFQLSETRSVYYTGPDAPPTSCPVRAQRTQRKKLNCFVYLGMYIPSFWHFKDCENIHVIKVNYKYCWYDVQQLCSLDQMKIKWEQAQRSPSY